MHCPVSITHYVSCSHDAMLGALGGLHTVLCVHAMLCWYSVDKTGSPGL